VVGVGLAAATGWLWLDPVVAIGVAANILREGVSLMWRSTEGLMDRALEPDVLEEIDKTLAQFKHRTIRFDHVSSRRSGRRRFVDLHMHMPANVTQGRAAALRASVEQALMSAVPGLRATIQLLPNNVEPHSGDEEDLI
jgi:divalent metal cation (Fe/Co/Zn/Cd) transporter